MTSWKPPNGIERDQQAIMGYHMVGYCGMQYNAIVTGSNICDLFGAFSHSEKYDVVGDDEKDYVQNHQAV